MKLFIYLFIAVLSANASNGQCSSGTNRQYFISGNYTDFPGQQEDSSLDNTLPQTFKTRLSLGAHFGTQGFGGALKLQMTSRLYVRLGASTIPINYPNEIATGRYTSNFNFHTNFTNIHLFGEWNPFSRSSFRLVGGLGYFVNDKMDIKLQPDGVYNYGYIALTGTQVGEINASISWKNIAPYLGLGLGKGMPQKHRFGLNLDMGVYYLSKPTAVISGTNLLNGTGDNTAQLNNNASGYRWLPVLQLNFCYKIIK